MAIFFIVVLIVFVLIAGAALNSSPSWRFWSRGKGAVDPTGNPVPSSHEFERPPNDGDLL